MFFTNCDSFFTLGCPVVRFCGTFETCVFPFLSDAVALGMVDLPQGDSLQRAAFLKRPSLTSCCLCQEEFSDMVRACLSGGASSRWS